MKRLWFVAVLSFIVISGFSQLGRKQFFTVSLGIEGSKTTGSFSNTHSIGLGASAQAELALNKAVRFTAYAGYLNFFGKTVQQPEGEFKYASISQIPLLAGLRWYPATKVLYFSGQLGTSIFNRGYGSAFTYAPGVGIRLIGTDIMLRYLGAEKNGKSFSSTNLRLALTL